MYSARKESDSRIPNNIDAYIQRNLIVKNTPSAILPTGKAIRYTSEGIISEDVFMQQNPPVRLSRGESKGNLIGTASKFL